MTISSSSQKLRVATVKHVSFLGEMTHKQLTRAIVITIFVGLWLLTQQSAQAASYADARHSVGSLDHEVGSISQYLKTAQQQKEKARTTDSENIQDSTYVMVIVGTPPQPVAVATAPVAPTSSPVYPLYFD